MKTMTFKHLLSAAAAMALCACSAPDDASLRVVEDFNARWRFALSDTIDASAPGYDDAEWRVLDLPHDWAIEGDFSEKNPSGTGGGALPGGIGWYRKEFELTKADLQRQIFVEFDGVYMNSEVFINGTSVGKRPYGYISFQYELTPHAREGRNVLAVRVDNSEQPNSRWYSGCGIYRNVRLSKLNPTHVDHWGTYITTPVVNRNRAGINMQTTVRNGSQIDGRIDVRVDIVDSRGKTVDSQQKSASVGRQSKATFVHEFSINSPQFWSIETPVLYKAVATVYCNGAPTDRYVTPFGIRSFYFDSEEGFSLNNKNVKINGVCLHHDLGCLGAAVNRRAIERQLQIMKDMGCNAIRCSHNPPAPELLELCDSMGFLVMDEAFDMWRKKKTAHDYSRYFNQWHERDLTDLVMRDRNHPSIVMWSIGNEVLEQWTDANADTLDIAAANLLLNMKRDRSSLAGGEEELSVNSLLCRKLADMVHELDNTRPVTTGNNEPDPANHLFKANALDIIGFNYHNAWFDGVPQNFPGKPFIVSESVSALMTRGYYRMPSDEIFMWPERWDKPFFDDSFSCSSYDNCHAPWGNTHEETLDIVQRNGFISGQFIWTGFDYIGEPTPYGWPARSSFFGIVDLAGFPKDVYYLYQSEWTDKDVLHLFPHWNWKPGQTIDMWAYYNHADSIELFVNGKSQGIRRKAAGQHHAQWRVNFEEGQVKAVTIKNGKPQRETIINTAGAPAQIRLTPDRQKICADGRDLSFVTVEILDSKGNLCPTATNSVSFDIDGTGFIAGVDNGSPISLERFKDSKRKAFYGKCLVVIQNNGKIGDIRLTATSKGLQQADLLINCLPKSEL